MTLLTMLIVLLVATPGSPYFIRVWLIYYKEETIGPSSKIMCFSRVECLVGSHSEYR